MQITFLSGQANAALVAIGIPKPIDPRVTDNQSYGLAPIVKGLNHLVLVIDPSTSIAFSGIKCPMGDAIEFAVKASEKGSSLVIRCA